MKPFRKQKIVLLALSMMLLCQDITFKPVYADPETNDPADTTDPGTEGDTTPPGDNAETLPPEGENPDENTPVTPPSQEEEEEPVYIPSGNNLLDGLSVKGFELSPSFQSDINEYSLKIDGSNTNIEIIADTQHYLASVEGTGKFDVSYEVGSYDFKIDVYAENGALNSYVIHLTVSSDPFLFAPYDGEMLGFVIKGLDQLVLPVDGFEMRDGSFDGKKITMFNNKNFPFNLVYLENTNKKQDWYCYEKGIVTGIFRSLTINKTKYYYAGVNSDIKKQDGYSYGEQNILGEKLNGWKVNSDTSKIMMYLYDNMGNADFYIYDTDDQTMQRRREFEVTETKQNESFLKSPITITVLIIFVIAGVFAFNFLRAGKKRITFGKKRKEQEIPSFDQTVELVRTSKVKIFADNPAPQLEQTKEFHFDLKEKQMKPEEPTVVEELVEEKTEIEIDTPEVIEENVEEKEETQPKEKKSFFKFKKKQKEEKVEENIPEEELQEEKTVEVENVVDEEIKEDEEVSTQEQQPKEKKSFFNFMKKDKPKVEKEPEVEESVEEVIETNDKPIQNDEKMDDYDEIEAMQEIQKYIDQLFYLDENK